MSADDRLRTRRSEHVALLKQLERVLQADQRIVAAWLFGSEARRTSDVLSDLDVWVIVKDEFIETISAEQVTQLSTYLWAMSNIAVKSVLRHQAWAAVIHLAGLLGIVDGMKRLVGLSTVREGQAEWRTTLLPPVHRAEQMAMLREIAREMEHLTNAIERIGGQVPSQAIPYVYDFFDLADALLQQEETEQVTSYRRRED